MSSIFHASDYWDRAAVIKAAFEKCRWFSRGWCLQELLAPANLLFVNSTWKDVGTKDDLSQIIGEITKIPRAVLRTPPQADIQDCSVAERISWIADRQTTRIEDMAYSLLGIVGVHMPMLYGEGEGAFIRLQHEIIRKYNDPSIFAWDRQAPSESYLTVLDIQPLSGNYSPVLARAASCFAGHSLSANPSTRLTTQFSLTNQGVLFTNAELRYQKGPPGYSHQYLLNLHLGQGTDGYFLRLQKIGQGLFIRIRDNPSRRSAFSRMPYSPPFTEAVCILDGPPSQLTRQVQGWAQNAIRLHWRSWGQPFDDFNLWHIRSAEPRANWDLAANQFLLELSPADDLHVEFVPGNRVTNPDSKYLVVAIRVSRFPNGHDVYARLVPGETWEGMHRSRLGFRGEESKSVQFGPSLLQDGANRISIAGYDITMSIKHDIDGGGLFSHCIYLNWDDASLALTGTTPTTAKTIEGTTVTDTARATADTKTGNNSVFNVRYGHGVPERDWRKRYVPGSS